MSDFWNECFDPTVKMPPKDFERTFCRVCRNPQCERSAGSRDPWAQRMATQVDRLLVNPKFADPNDPQFKDIRDLDFPSALREAMRIEISDRRGDWSVPSAQDVAALAASLTAQPSRPSEPVESPFTEKVLRTFSVKGDSGETYTVSLEAKAPGSPPRWTCTCKAFAFRRVDVCKHIQAASQEPEPEEEVEAPPASPPQPTQAAPARFAAPPTPPDRQAAPQPATRPFYPTVPNIPMPPGGVMIDGSAPPLPRLRQAPAAPAAPVHDPWAPPPKKKQDVVVPVGGKVVIGGNREKE